MMHTGTGGSCPEGVKLERNYKLRDSNYFIDTYFNDHFSMSKSISDLLPDTSLIFNAIFEVSLSGKISNLKFDYDLPLLVQKEIKNFIYYSLPPINSSFKEFEKYCFQIKHFMVFKIMLD
ncbi:MAG: hypothetical protein EYC69_05405 [Bacteroidetes bacterium]|nr:MAG: hypothetical protein EYC69_05405 [Bacteroidota bacterium]